MDGVYAENCREQFQCIFMDGVYAENCLARFQCISMDGVYAENCREQFQCISMDEVAGKSLLHFLHSPHPCGSYAENCQEQFQCIYIDSLVESWRKMNPVHYSLSDVTLPPALTLSCKRSTTVESVLISSPAIRLTCILLMRREFALIILK